VPPHVRILVVDDNLDTLGCTARLLEKAGYAVSRAASGEDSLQAAAEHRPDLNHRSQFWINGRTGSWTD
jgi:CheY-like chemotaxis protein